MALIGEMKYLQIGSNTYEIPTSELPIASSSTLGGIKVGTNLSIDSSTGVLSVTGIPSISITRNLTSGTKSATINIDGTDYDIYSTTPPSAATTAPVVDGTAAVGSSSKYAKEDHVHPTDTSRAATTTVATQASINSTGLITYKNSGGTSLFTLQLPLYNGGVS